MEPLTIDAVLSALAEGVISRRYNQISDPQHPDYGGFLNPRYNFATATNDYGVAFVTAVSYLYMAARRAGQPMHREDLQRAIWAMDYQLRAQDADGLVDLRECNYASAPDIGFICQRFGTVLELGWKLNEELAAARDDVLWQELLQKVATFTRRAADGMLTGGFHTPNHRWVISSALAQCHSLFDDFDATEVINSYLAETIDIDAEGTYIERSVGVYDAVCDRSLLLLAENWEAAAHVREAVRANLDFDLQLLHADATAETGLSRRQDYGTRAVPLGLVHALLVSHAEQANPTYVAAAQLLWQQATPAQRSGGDGIWLAYVLLKYGQPPQVPPALPNNFIRHFPLNRLWRLRRNLLSVSAFGDVTRLLTMTYGQAELSSLKITGGYFNRGSSVFVGDEMEAQDEQVVLTWSGLHDPRRPGYEMPLGEPVPPQEWEAALLRRDIRRLPPLRSRLTLAALSDGLELQFQTLDGADKVIMHMALDFPPGGIWETEDTSFRPQAGQVIFLKRGFGRMRYGSDVLEIGPGAYAHRMEAMRHSETAPDHVRVVLTFFAPVEHRLVLRGFRGLGSNVLPS